MYIRHNIFINLYNDLGNFSRTNHVHDWNSITNRPSTFIPSSHNHNDIYYTESEIINLLNKYSLSTHNHDNTYAPIDQIIYITTDPGDNVSSSLEEGTLICVYEEV